MSPEEKLPEELKAFEAALASLTPSSDRLSRDRVMYLAGQTAVSMVHPHKKKIPWAWPAAFSAMTAVAVTLAVLLVNQPKTLIAERKAIPATTPIVDPQIRSIPQYLSSMTKEESQSFLKAIAEISQVRRAVPEESFRTMIAALLGRSLPPFPHEADNQTRTAPHIREPLPSSRQFFEELFSENSRYRM
jgi:hypothetical protein